MLETFGRLEAATTVALEGAEVAAARDWPAGTARSWPPARPASLLALGRWDDAEPMLRRAADRVAPELAATQVYIHTISAASSTSPGDWPARPPQHLAVAR